MSLNKIFTIIAVTILVNALSFGVVAYFIAGQLFEGGGSWIGPAKEPWEFKVALVAIYGAVIGAMIGFGSVILKLSLSFGAAFGFATTLVLGALTYFYLGSSWSAAMTKIFYASIIVAMISGAVSSLLNPNRKPGDYS